MAQAWLNRYGWGGQFAALNSIITHESGWNPNAVNPSSGAYGLGQALPASVTVNNTRILDRMRAGVGRRA